MVRAVLLPACAARILGAAVTAVRLSVSSYTQACIPCPVRLCDTTAGTFLVCSHVNLVQSGLAFSRRLCLVILPDPTKTGRDLR
jgi:hypothetical protein